MRVNELLCYAVHVFQSTPRENLKTFLLGFYDDDEIASAKTILFDDFKTDLGKAPSRRGSNNRSEAEADISDLLDAIEKLDKKKIHAEFSAINMQRIPLEIPGASHHKCSGNGDDLKNVSNKLDNLTSLLQVVAEATIRKPSYAEVTEHSVAGVSEAHLADVSRIPMATGIIPDPPESIERKRSTQQRPVVLRAGTSTISSTRSKPVMVGNGKCKDGSTTLKAAPLPLRDFFLYRLDKDTTCEAVHHHLMSRCGVKVIRHVEKTSHTDAKFGSFKFSIPVDETDKVLNPDNWASGIRIRRYFSKRTRAVNETGDPSPGNDISNRNLSYDTGIQID